MIFADHVSEDNSDDDDDKDDNNNDDDDDENSDEDTHNEDRSEEDDANGSSDNKDKNCSVNDNDEDNTMPPKLKSVALQPPKKGKRIEPQVEKLTRAVSKKLNITTPPPPPPAKPYSMTTLDGYVVKPYTHRFVDFVEVDIHV